MSDKLKFGHFSNENKFQLKYGYNSNKRNDSKFIIFYSNPQL